MRVFVAYSGVDANSVNAVVKALRQEQIDLWYAPYELRRDEKNVAQAIERELRASGAFLCCLGSGKTGGAAKPRGEIDLSKELDIAMEIFKNDPEFKILTVQLMPNIRIPPGLREHVLLDLSSDSKWEQGLATLSRLFLG